MLDQTFTTENFRRIYDEANRRGVNLETRFFPELNDLTKQVKSVSSAIRQSRTDTERGTKSDPEIATLKEQRRELRSRKEDTINNLLEALSEKIRASPMSVTLEKKMGPGGKYVWPFADSPENYFISRQLQRNLNRLYSIKQGNRFNIVSQLKESLRAGFPYHLVRTDVSSFYESINRANSTLQL